MREPELYKTDLEGHQNTKARYVAQVAQHYITLGLAAVGLCTAIVTLWKYALS